MVACPRLYVASPPLLARVLPDLAGSEVEDLEWFIEDDVPLKECMKALIPKKGMERLDPKAHKFEDEWLKSKGTRPEYGGREQTIIDGRFHRQGKTRAADWELEPRYQSRVYKATIKCKYLRFGKVVGMVTSVTINMNSL